MSIGILGLLQRAPSSARVLSEPLPDYVLRVERLLLVGQPGAGKTHTLRTLCEHLLEVAERDPRLPVPFIVNLSTLSNYRGSLRAWLSEGLKECAAIPLAIGRALLEQGQLFLLLDGLDEMAPQRRGRALAELNALLVTADPALARCVVCSRTMEYTEAGVPLMLPTALELQPVPPEQLHEAITQAGPRAASLQAAIAKDQMLKALLQTPLLINIAMRVFGGTPNLALAGRSPIDLRQQIYDAYVVQMLRRNTTKQACNSTMGWLRFTAQHLTREKSSLFLVERLQPSALSTQRSYNLALGLTAGPLLGLEFVAIFGFVGLFFGLFFGLYTVVETVVHGRQSTTTIEPVEHLRWSWAQAWKTLQPIVIVELPPILIFGLFVGLVSGLIAGFIDGLNAGLRAGLIGGLNIISFMTLFKVRPMLPAVIHNGWSRALREQSAQPNQGIHASIQNGVREGIIGGLVGGLINALYIRKPIYLGVGLAAGLINGQRGLSEALKHYVLRLFLWREGKLPLRLVPWLEGCRACLLLRRQGGAYMFWHRTLQDYLAELDDEKLADLAKRIDAKPEYVQTY